MALFNREILALARESRGFTQLELSKLLNVEQGTISKIESGSIDISDDVDKLIPDALGYPRHLFAVDKKSNKGRRTLPKEIVFTGETTKRIYSKNDFCRMACQ